MTAAELLAECQARKIDLQPHGGQLDIDAPQGSLTPDLLQALRIHKGGLLRLLTVIPAAGGSLMAGGPRPGDSGDTDRNTAGTGETVIVSPAVPPDLAAAAAPRPRSAAPVAVEWPAAAADFALLLAVDDLPPVPFRSNAWTETRDAGKFLRWLRADILRGPGGPRAFYGALQADLRELQRFALQAADNRQREGRPQR